MNIYIDNQTESDIPNYYGFIINDVIKGCLDFLNCPYECEASVIITDDHGIMEINSAERGIDAPTDVLSFPMLDFEKPNDLSYVEKYPQDYFNPETGELLLGDIVISIERINFQAEQYGHSDKRELAFLVAHSMFHLFGYDHMEEKEREVMEDLQSRILEKKGYTRDYE